MNLSPRIVVIGGVAGGASAAARARRHSETAQIVLLERGPDVSFANCGLPYHLGGEITDRDRLAVQTPASLQALLNLDVRTNTEAIRIDRDAQQVVVRNTQSGEESAVDYDHVILAPGAQPLHPPLPGIDLEGIHSLRNLQDMDRIKADLETTESALIIGAGFIGLEMAEQLHHLGKKVTVVELQPQVLPQVDPDIAAPITDQLRSHGVEVLLGDAVESFSQEGSLITARLGSGKELQAGLVILSIGVAPETSLAKEAGLETGPRGHIVVNEYQQTSDPVIYAAGDACETADPILGGRVAVPLGGPANRQGRTAADHLFLGEKALPYPGSIGTSIVRVFDRTVATTGYQTRRLEAAGVNFDQVIINGGHHAGYYPGATNMTLKLLWRRSDGRILGASAVGVEGVDKRMDVLATAIHGKMTIDDLCHVELSYAPPFGSAKDPVNVAAFAACNIRDGLVATVADPTTLSSLQVVDVRPTQVAELRPLKTSLPVTNIPLPELRGRLGELDKARPVATICAMGKTSYFAGRILALNGFDVQSLAGGVTGTPSLLEPASTTPAPAMPSTSPSPVTEADQNLDCTGLACPGPILKVKEAVDALAPGATLKVTASDGGFTRDLPAFCEANGLELLDLKEEKGLVIGTVQKPLTPQSAPPGGKASNQDATLVVFSQEMDKVMAGLVIANGAIAMGGQATLFFTFWGLNALRDPAKGPVEGKTAMDKMFGTMLPKGLPALPLSNMNFAGMGKKMMVDRMADKDLPNVQGLLKDALAGGARLVACSMSMEAMGIRREELIDGIEVGGVAEFLGASSKSGTQLFI